MSKKKILILLEHLRVDHTIQHRDGTTTIDFLGTKMGALLKQKMRSIGLTPKDFDLEYIYGKIPEPKSIDSRTQQPTSYKDIPIKEFSKEYPRLNEKIVAEEYDIVIPTGRMGCKYLLDQVSITKLRGIPERKEITIEKKPIELHIQGQVVETHNEDPYVDSHEFWVFPMFSMEYIDFKRNAEISYDGDLVQLDDFIKNGDTAFLPTEVNYEYTEDITRIREIFARVRDEKMLTSWDIETNTLRPDMEGAKMIVFSIAHKERQGVTFPVDHKEHTWAEEDREEIIELIKEYVANKETYKVGQNIGFDIRFLMRAYGMTEFHNHLDTKVAYYLTVSQDKAKSFTLSTLAYEMTDMGGYDKPLDEWRENYIKEYRAEHKEKPVNEVDGSDFNYEWFPLRDFLAPYAAGDVDATLRVHNVLAQNIAQHDAWVDLYYKFYPRVTVALAAIEAWGFQADPDYFDVLDTEYNQERDRILEAIRKEPAVEQLEEESRMLYEEGLKEWAKPKAERDEEVAKLRDRYKNKLEFNPNSPNDKKRVLFDIVGAQPPANKDTLVDSATNKSESEITWEDYKTDKNMMKWIKDNIPEASTLADLLLEYSSVSTLLSTFVNGLRKQINPITNTIHGGYNITGTECVSGDTTIVTSEGLIPIEEISDNRTPKTFSDVDLKVMSRDGIQKVGGFYYSGISDGLKFTLADGTQITTTKNHPLLVSNYIKPGKALNRVNKVYKEKHVYDNDWVEASDIKEGDYIIMRYNTQMYGTLTELTFEEDSYRAKTFNDSHITLPQTITPELSEWLGMYMADGSYSTSNGGFGIKFGNNSPEVQERYKKLTRRLFNIDCHFAIGSSERSDSLEISSVKIGRYLIDQFGIESVSHKKSVPSKIMRSTKEVQEGFIRGLTLDTSVHKKEYPSLYFSSVSENMMKDVRSMLLNMGIYSRFSTREVTRNRANNPNINKTHEVMVTYEDLTRYMETIGVIQTDKKETIERKLAENGKVGKHIGTVKESDIDTAFVRVVKIEEVFKTPFFDLNVPSNNSFVGNGIVNHNTGRLSSSRPNMQNIPSTHQKVDKFDYKYPIKRLFTTRFDGGVVLQADYSALEMRILGLRANDPGMTEAFLEGKDIHKNTASIMQGKPEDTISGDEREDAKTIAFGLIYGKQTFSLANDMGVTPDEAEVLVNKFFAGKPAVRGFIEYAHEFLEKNGYVETMNGHRRILRDVWGNKMAKSEALRQSVNTIIQGTGAYLTNYSVALIYEYLKEYNKKSMLVATVHDSIVVDVHPDEIEEVTQVVKYIMENVPAEFLYTTLNGQRVRYPIEADIEIGHNYNDLVDYDAEDFKTFNSPTGYIKYRRDIKLLIDHEESGKITEEQLEEAIQIIENQKAHYQHM